MKKVLLLVAIMTGSVLNAQILPSGVPTTNLKAYYSFNSSLNDLSGNNHTASYLGNSSRVDGYRTCLDSANNFQGTNGWGGTSNSIEFPATLMTAMNNLSAGSVSLCFKLDSIADHNHSFGIDNTLLVKQKHGSNTELNLSIQNGKVRFHLTGGFPSATNFVSTTTVSINVWYNVTCSWDGQTIKMYINGVLDNSMSSSATLSNMSSPSYFAIGALSGMGSYGSYSSIDNVAFWSSSLSSSEVSQLYQSQLNCCSDSISSQPSSTSFTTVPGTANFTVSHSDSSATYQWQQNVGTGWNNISDFGIYSGATTDSLGLNPISTALNGYGYRCLVNSCNMDTTNIAVLTVVVGDIGVNEIVKDIIVSPNPTYGLLNIVLTSSAEYEVFNITGQRVAQGKTEGQIDITNLPTGSYQLIINNDDGRSTHTIQKI
jgi:hypothetical protein